MGKMGDPIQKVNETKKAGDMPQKVKHLPHKHEALSSNTSTTKNNDKVLILIFVLNSMLFYHA
jgi:hypothetical protein